MSTLLSGAVHSLDLSLYTFEHPSLALLVADAAERGVQVRLLLDGAPPGGISQQQKWCVTRIAEAGGEVRYLAVIDDTTQELNGGFRFTHAKYGIVDGRSVFVGTEDLVFDAMPKPSFPAGGWSPRFLSFHRCCQGGGDIAQPFCGRLAARRFFYDMHRYEATDAKYGAPSVDFVLPAPTIYNVGWRHLVR